MGHSGHAFLFWLLLSSFTAPIWAAPRRPAEHVVQSGQTLGKIAKRYQLTIEELCEANDLSRASKLKPGQTLSLPNEDEDATLPRTRQRTRAERSPASVGRSSDTTQKVGIPRNASYSRYLGRPVKRGYVHVMGYHGEYKGQLLGKSGKLQPKAAIALSRILAWPRTDFVMDRRLLTLLAKISDAFGGRTLRLVSGYRKSSYVSESKHPLGRACDFSVLGVPNSALREYIRTFRNVGVGYYPNSSFVHLDVREYDAQWIDYAGPGEKPRARPNAIAKKKANDGNTDATDRSDNSAPERLSRNAESADTEVGGNVDPEALVDTAEERPTVSERTAKATKTTDTSTEKATDSPPSEAQKTPPTKAAASTAETL